LLTKQSFARAFNEEALSAKSASGAGEATRRFCMTCIPARERPPCGETRPFLGASIIA